MYIITYKIACGMYSRSLYKIKHIPLTAVTEINEMNQSLKKKQKKTKKTSKH